MLQTSINSQVLAPSETYVNKAAIASLMSVFADLAAAQL